MYTEDKQHHGFYENDVIVFKEVIGFYDIKRFGGGVLLDELVRKWDVYEVMLIWLRSKMAQKMK